jgi:hypothetical protein
MVTGRVNQFFRCIGTQSAHDFFMGNPAAQGRRIINGLVKRCQFFHGFGSFIIQAPCGRGYDTFPGCTGRCKISYSQGYKPGFVTKSMILRAPIQGHHRSPHGRHETMAGVEQTAKGFTGIPGGGCMKPLAGNAAVYFLLSSILDNSRNIPRGD